MVEFAFRVGDVLEVSCPFTEAVVSEVSGGSVAVRWPWWRHDPDVGHLQWNGNVALALGPGTLGWADELFHTEPPAGDLEAGAACRVGIPPTIVHVIEAQSFDPPLETGWLPRPRREIVVLRHGVSQNVDAVEQGTGINPDDEIPFRIDLVLRPYAFLNLGDDVADADGRAWSFRGPWDWQAFDEQGGIPTWPLTALAGGGRHEAAVAAATASGSHEAEIDQWRRATRAEPPR